MIDNDDNDDNSNSSHRPMCFHDIVHNEINDTDIDMKTSNLSGVQGCGV